MTNSVATYDVSRSGWDDEDGELGSLQSASGCLPLQELDIQATVDDLFSEVAVHQVFVNSARESVEATYVFPLPSRAAVTRFTMRVAGRVVESELQEREAARKAYQQAILDGYRSSIAEQERPNVFTLRVGNLPPGERVKIELGLIMPIDVSEGIGEFRFPLVVAPRYVSGMPLDRMDVGWGEVHDTNEVPDASRVTPPVFLPGYPNPVRLSLGVTFSRAAISPSITGMTEMRCSLHNVVVEEGEAVTVRLRPGERLNRDFILRFPVAGESVKTSLVASRCGEGHPGVFALTVVPPKRDESIARRFCDIVFVVDRSGSMNGWKMVAARRAVGRMVDALEDNDRFHLLAFDDRIESFSRPGELMPARNKQRWEAVEWIGKITARGGTEISTALSRALKCFDGHDLSRRQIIVVVTDGQVAGEDRVLEQLRAEKNSEYVQLFPVGIDQSVNDAFLWRLAEQFHGACELVESEQALDDALGRIQRILAPPVLTDLRIEMLQGVSVPGSLVPSRKVTLFAGRPVTLMGRFQPAEENRLAIRLHGTDPGGHSWSMDVEARSPDEKAHKSLLGLWGRGKIRQLEDRVSIGNDQEALHNQIVATSLECHVLSRFTAMVAVDRSESVNGGGLNRVLVQPVELPGGWEKCGPPTMSARSTPNTNTNVRMSLDSLYSYRGLSLFAEVKPPRRTNTITVFTNRETSETLARVIQVIRRGLQLSATEVELRCDGSTAELTFRQNEKHSSRPVQQHSQPLTLEEAKLLVEAIRIMIEVPIAKRFHTEHVQSVDFELDRRTLAIDVHIPPARSQCLLRLTMIADSRCSS
ncbi:MAG: VIT domain-containing protein [Planctomycetaceae bacterium]